MITQEQVEKLRLAMIAAKKVMVADPSFKNIIEHNAAKKTFQDAERIVKTQNLSRWL